MKKLIERIKQNEDFRDLVTSSPKDILNGNILTKKFFRRQYLLIALIVFLAVLYINNRYESEKMMTQISTLKKDIQDAKYESLTISAELVEISRQSNIQQLLNSRNMKLKPGMQSPIVIK
ncbi:MAG: FtsL-like putative cell division protein [Paludibacter sp.]|nr:FtsL-like putative cell division protein [Paludibacter sp.]